MPFTNLSNSNLKTSLPEFNYCGCWIAGGAIRDSILGIPYSDIDIFGSESNLNTFKEKNLHNCNQIYDSPNLKSFTLNKTKIQLIYRNYSTIQECLESFDFTICMFAYDGKDILCYSDALIHLFNKRLVINKINPNFAVDSLRRMTKYIKKEYSICNGGIKEMVDAIRGMSQEQVNNQISFYPDKTPRILRFD